MDYIPGVVKAAPAENPRQFGIAAVMLVMGNEVANDIVNCLRHSNHLLLGNKPPNFIEKIHLNSFDFWNNNQNYGICQAGGIEL